MNANIAVCSWLNVSHGRSTLNIKAVLHWTVALSYNSENKQNFIETKTLNNSFTLKIKLYCGNW